MDVHAVLYVEDDDAAFLLVHIVLKEQAPAVQLFRARNGDEALAFLRTAGAHPEAPLPDLILLDLNLPGKTGLEVLSDLKASESLRLIPVVVFSTSAAGHDRNNALGGGAQDYITKPTSFDSFVEAVKRACCLNTSSAQAGR